MRGKGTRFIEISFRSTLREPSNLAALGEGGVRGTVTGETFA